MLDYIFYIGWQPHLGVVATKLTGDLIYSTREATVGDARHRAT